MRIPLDWLKEYVKLPKNQSDLTDKLTMAGHMLDKIEKTNGKIKIDLELRGNRADCYSILGIAREVSALFNTPVNYPKIDTKIKKVTKLNKLNLDIKTKLVRRVMMSEIKDVKIIPSPKWLKEKLETYGIASINNIVDLTNYVMIESGQPMHAFDFDKIGQKIEIRLAKENEQITTFLDRVVSLSKYDLVWANKESVLSIAGAIGGKKSSISENTKRILVECANYERSNIRKSIHRLNLLTEAGIRHEKDIDPNLCQWAICRFLQLVKDYKWGKVEPLVSDYYPNPVKEWSVVLDFDYLYSLGGLKINPNDIFDILRRLNFTIANKTPRQFEVMIPTYRTDVVSEEDLIEEILRIYGYDKIPSRALPLEIPEPITPSCIYQEINIRDTLVSLGFDEVISSSFVRENLLNYNETLDNKSKCNPVKISNRPSPDAEELRKSLLPNLFEYSQKILNERGASVYLFEVGKIYCKNQGKYIEKRKLGIIYYQKGSSEYVYFKGLLDALFDKLNLFQPQFKTEKLRNQYLTNTYKITIGKNTIGFGGQLKGNIFFAEIDLDSILNKTNTIKAILWPKYPPQIEDITLKLPPNTKVGDIISSIYKSSQFISDIELRDIYQDAYTLRISYQSPEKTLNNKEIEIIREKILNEIGKNFGAILKP
jgi:phenylalanyl-tRNA synthetase beta chain